MTTSAECNLKLLSLFFESVRPRLFLIDSQGSGLTHQEGRQWP